MPQEASSAEITVHWKFFNQYFADAAEFAHSAAGIKTKATGNPLNKARDTRAAIFCSALALESAANCCLDVLQLQKGVFEDFDKLQTLGKFEVFLRYIHPQKTLDRENILVCPIRNLIACRNTYVHSKVLSETTDQGAITPNIWQPLGLPHNSAYWQPLHAVKTFTVLSDFLNYFFFEVCGYPYEGFEGRSTVVHILSSGLASAKGAQLPGGVPFSSVRSNEVWVALNAAHAWDLEFAFLGTYTSDGGGKMIYPKRKWGDYSHCKVEELSIPPQHLSYSIPSGLGILSIRGKGKQKHMKG